jgi:hypothetical protein
MTGCADVTDGSGGFGGFDGHGGFGHGLCGGFDGHGLDAMDFLSGPERHARQSLKDLDFRGIFVSPDGDICAAHVLGHREVSLHSVFMKAAEDAGLLKVPPILVGQRALIDQRSCSILPTNAWSGAEEGVLPPGCAEGMRGSTVMFRYYFQIPKREWGVFSNPVYDSEAGAYLDVSGMTWDYDIGDSESQLFVRVMPMARHNDHRTVAKVDAHRQAALKVVKRVHELLSLLSPPPEEVEARLRIKRDLDDLAPSSLEVPSPSSSPQPEVATGGADNQPIAADTRPNQEMVTVRITLPRR